LRLALGVGFAYFGYLKLFDPAGHEAARDLYQAAGLPMHEALAWIVGGVEFLCGLAVLLGIATRFASILLICVVALMVAAQWALNGSTFEGIGSAGEAVRELGLSLAMLAMLVSLILGGPGAYAMQAPAKRSRKAPAG
jgi:putative oxidoreductase